MGNIQKTLILYVSALSLNFLTADKGGIAAEALDYESCQIKPTIYFKSNLTSKWKSKVCCFAGRDYAFISKGNGRLWIHSTLLWVMFDQERYPENPGYRHKEINLKKLQNT